MPAHLRSSQHQLGWLVDQGLESYEIKLLIFISASWGGHMPTTGAESLGEGRGRGDVLSRTSVSST